MGKFLFVFLPSSVLGALLTTFSYAITSSGKIELKSLWLPAVAEIALGYGFVLGLLLSPLMYWSLRDKNLIIAVPILYVLAVGVTVALAYVDPRVSFLGAFIYWPAALLAMKHLAPVIHR